MRIALVHYSYPPVIGGVENVVAAHARLFAQHGHDVSIFTRGAAKEQPGLKIIPLPTEGEGDLTRTLCGLFEKQAVVFLHNVCTMPFDLALTEALWQAAELLPATRFVCWVHDLAACNPAYSPTGDPRWSLLSRANQRFAYVVVSAHRARQLLALSGVAAEIIPNGLEPSDVLGLTPAIAELARAHDLLRRDVVLLHPTRLLPRKRVEFSVDLLAALKESGCSATLIVTAACDPHHSPSSDYAETLRALSKQLGVDREALFLGPERSVSLADLASLYRLADAVLFPSAEEGFGIPLLEAALHRVPFFCSDAPAHNALRLPGQHLFPLDVDPRERARVLASGVRESALAQARKAVARDSAWEVIYDRFLAPFVANLNAAHANETHSD